MTQIEKNKQLCDELQARGLVFQQSAESIHDIFDSDVQRVAYLGVDPTADSIHIGNLITYILAQHLIQAGHTVHFLVGGATGLIGDPSGKSEERKMSEPALVKERVLKIQQQIQGLHGLDYDRDVLNNLDWFKDISLIEFLRDIGKHFTVNTMIKKESVKKRLEGDNGISYTEFSYSLFQAYDFLHLNTEVGCDVQIGGADQWGNIVAGIDLIRRKVQKEAHGVTIPLIVDKVTGKKFGKSESGAVWLDPTKTSYYEFFQFWLNISDESAIEYLKLFTFLPFDQIEAIANEMHTDAAGRAAQKALAYEVTAFVYGPEIADDMRKTAALMFGQTPIWELSTDQAELIKKYVPTTALTTAVPLIDMLIEHKLASSKREAREFISGNAIKINGAAITDLEYIVEPSNYSEKIGVIQRGKKKKVIFTV